MKLTAQADFYIEKYGPQKGIEILRNLGYQNIIYTLAARVLEPFLDENKDAEMRKKFEEIRDAAKDAEVNILFTTMKEEIYSDLFTCIPDAKIANVKAAIKATSYMGCEMLAVRPICFRKSIPNAWEETKKVTYQIYGGAKKDADSLGVKIAFLNTTKQLCFSSGTYSYGCNAEDLIELADEFESGVVINPVYALKSGEKVEEMLDKIGDKVIGFMIDDKTQRIESQGMPFFGAVDYYGLIRYFETHPSDMAMVMTYSSIMNRYSEFADDMEFVEALTKAFKNVACVIAR